MADSVALMPVEYNQLLDVSSGALRFKLKHEGNRMQSKIIILCAKESPHQEYYKVIFSSSIDVHDCEAGRSIKTQGFPEENFDEFQAYWICWHNGVFKLGFGEELTPLIKIDIDEKKRIGYANFREFNSSGSLIKWIVDRSPVNLEDDCLNKVFGGELHWVKMTVNDPLPQDAMIGGFEDESLYIIRAFHNNSLCPGKFLAFSKQAFVPWGHEEHAKEEFEVLCGFDVHWVSTDKNNIPVNAVVAGYSEVRREPLYIGRAMHDDYLLVGKVHTLYGSCYLPYKGREIEVKSYQILVKGDPSQSRALFDLNNDENDIVF